MKAMKKFFKIVWKGLLGLAVASVALFGVVLGWAWYEDYTSYYNDAFLSDDVMVRHYYSQREYKVYNRQLDKITLKDWIRWWSLSRGIRSRCSSRMECVDSSMPIRGMW